MSRKRPDVAQRVPGGLDSMTFGMWRWWRCQPHAPAAFTPQESFLVLIFTRGWADHRAMKRSEGICHWKIQWHPRPHQIMVILLKCNCVVADSIKLVSNIKKIRIRQMRPLTLYNFRKFFSARPWVWKPASAITLWIKILHHQMLRCLPMEEVATMSDESSIYWTGSWLPTPKGTSSNPCFANPKLKTPHLGELQVSWLQGDVTMTCTWSPFGRAALFRRHLAAGRFRLFGDAISLNL